MKSLTMKLGGLVRLAVLFVALAFCMTGAAQRPYKYDSGHKYSLLSNWTLGVAGQYSNNHGVSDVGITALATKRIGDYWHLRYEATINGFRNSDAFDRYGTAMAGASLDFLNWMYLFGDVGAVVNPTMTQKIGLAADAGLGLNVNFGKQCFGWRVARIWFRITRPSKIPFSPVLDILQGWESPRATAWPSTSTTICEAPTAK